MTNWHTFKKYCSTFSCRLTDCAAQHRAREKCGGERPALQVALPVHRARRGLHHCPAPRTAWQLRGSCVAAAQLRGSTSMVPHWWGAEGSTAVDTCRLLARLSSRLQAAALAANASVMPKLCRMSCSAADPDARARVHVRCMSVAWEGTAAAGRVLRDNCHTNIFLPV